MENYYTFIFQALGNLNHTKIYTVHMNEEYILLEKVLVSSGHLMCASTSSVKWFMCCSVSN